MANGLNLYFKPGGDIPLLARLFAGFREDLAKSCDKALAKIAKLYEVEIKKGIRSQPPAGKAFEELAEETIYRKGSTKALIDFGDMIGSITTRKAKPGVYFVGLLRTSRNRSGVALANIGPVHEYGTKNGRIPARPFIVPILQSRAIRRRMNTLLQQFVRNSMRQKGWKV